MLACLLACWCVCAEGGTDIAVFVVVVVVPGWRLIALTVIGIDAVARCKYVMPEMFNGRWYRWVG